jgi:hypothetical protein
MAERPAVPSFFLPDSTGISAEMFGNALLIQFPDLRFEVPFSPLGKGFLTGTVDTATSFAANDLRAQIPRFSGEALVHNMALVDEVKTIATDKRVTWTDCPGLAAGAATIDRPNPRHHQTAPARGETSPPPMSPSPRPSSPS